MTNEPCSCWRCWFQSNFTPIVLLGIVFVSFVATVVLMHESSIEDKYVTWLEGFCGGAMTSLAVALKATGSVSHSTTNSESATPSAASDSSSDKTVIS
jgi:hypothetical protein